MINITIKFSDVFTKVQRSAEYLGQKNNAYDNLRIIDYDDEQLLEWYSEAMVSVGTALDRLLTKRIANSPKTNDVSLSLNISNNNAALVKDCVENFAAAHIFRMWVELVLPEYIEVSRSAEQERKQELLQIAYYREMPR